MAIGRLITAMVTPFDKKGNVDFKQAQKLATALLESGSDGLVLAGTTGESPTLNPREKIKLFSEVKEAVAGRGTVIASTGNYCTAESIKLTRAAESVGVDACLLVVPYYNRPSQEGLFLHFSAIARSTHLPCIMYNVPSRTVASLSAETVIKLGQVDNIIGIKEASGNLEQVARIIGGIGRQDYLVFSGNDADTLPILSLGGYGVISVASHLVGNQIKSMIAEFLAGHLETAARIHRDLMPLINALFVVSNPVPVKYALNKVGFSVGKPRLPLTEPDEKAASLIEATLRQYHLDLPINQ
ncbi:MAG: 4-hydroxy-tetrahydrodipicolinate synthase [Dehalococcoidia bacterium]|nr:4-hydroxy-tetrahydrodipicolinate synthase [Dehalococcoidia bacterium]